MPATAFCATSCAQSPCTEPTILNCGFSATPSWMPARDLVVDEDAGEAADLEEVAALRHLLGEVEHLVLAHLLEVDGDAPGAGLGDDAVEGDDGDAGVAGLLDRAVQRRRARRR